MSDKRAAVVYTSKYGSTEKYAKWICEETGADLIKGSEVTADRLSGYECIVFGGAVHAGGILGIKFLQKNYKKLSDKKIYVYAVGLALNDEESQKQCREINLAKKLSDIPCYFFKGAYDPKAVSGMDRTMMKVVRKMISGKKDKVEADISLIDAIDNGADYTDRESIRELADAVKEALK